MNQENIHQPKAAIHSGQFFAPDFGRFLIRYLNAQKPIIRMITSQDRSLLVSRARVFFENFPPIQSAIEMIADYAVGDAWDLTSGESELNENLIKLWNLWSENVTIEGHDIRKILWLASLSLDREGEFFVVFEKDNLRPLIKMIDPILVGDESTSPFKQAVKDLEETHWSYDGVFINKKTGKIDYYYLREPYQKLISAASCLMLYEPRYVDQYRGFPPISGALSDIDDLFEIKFFEKEGIKIASSIGLIEKNQEGIPDPEVLQSGAYPSVENQPKVEYYQGGTIRYFRSDSNSSIEQISNNRPGELTQGFIRDYIIRTVFSALKIPMELTWDPSSLGSAATRMLMGKLDRRITSRQITLLRLWKSMVNHFIDYYSQKKLLKISKDYYFSPSYPRRPSIDYGRDVRAEIDLYKIGAGTLSDIYGQSGEDFFKKIELKAREIAHARAIAEKYGIRFEDLLNFDKNQTNNGTSTNNAEEDEKQNKN